MFSVPKASVADGVPANDELPHVDVSLVDAVGVAGEPVCTVFVNLVEEEAEGVGVTTDGPDEGVVKPGVDDVVVVQEIHPAVLDEFDATALLGATGAIVARPAAVGGGPLDPLGQVVREALVKDAVPVESEVRK